MRPTLNRKVYTISPYSFEIYEHKVGYIGKESFIIEDYDSFDSNYEFSFNEYEETWFTSFAKAKAYLKKQFKELNLDEKFKLVEHNDHFGKWWRVE